MLAVPENFQDLLTIEKRAFAVVATASLEGAPLAAPVWFLTDPEHILVLTDRNSLKGRNMLVNPNVSLVIMAEHNSVRYIHIKGEVTEVTNEGYEDFSRQLWLKYTGRVPDENAISENSFVFKIAAKKVSVFDYS